MLPTHTNTHTKPFVSAVSSFVINKFIFTLDNFHIYLITLFIFQRHNYLYSIISFFTWYNSYQAVYILLFDIVKITFVFYNRSIITHPEFIVFILIWPLEWYNCILDFVCKFCVAVLHWLRQTNIVTPIIIVTKILKTSFITLIR